MVTIVDLQLEIVRRFEKFKNKRYLEEIKKIAEEIFREKLDRVIIFGSYVKGNMRPLSDIDVAIILKEQANEEERLRFYKEVNRRFGIHPFEFHIITKEEWENWYKRFIKEYVEV